MHPRVAVEKNIQRFKEQLSIIGLDYDWTREINTTDPAYYKFSQWIFLQIYKRGLAHQSFEPINWCPSCKTGLANEDLDGDKCERCGSLVEKKPLRQWVLEITKYADRLLEGIDNLQWPESIKELQRNWIGKSQGVNFTCTIKDLGIKVQMYNSVPQTYRAETFTVIAAEHPLIEKLITGTPKEKEVRAFIDELKKKKAANAFAEDDMEGIFTGRYIENYANTGRDLPIWIASYVVADYGTGMVNCSAHDTRDYAFAKKFNIPLHEVAEPLFTRNSEEDAVKKDRPFKERNAVVCVIKNPKTNTYLMLNWKKVAWKGFVIGGIEEGEDAATAGIREIQEETGYQNVRYVKDLGGIVHSQFYHAVKDVNRYAHFTPAYFELIDETRKEMAAEEQALHDVQWLSEEEMIKAITHEDMQYIWKRYLGTATPPVKNGILIEPTEFKGREWSEVREDIITFLEKNNFAQRHTNYKLRDWVFARQRYWGEPIPMVFDENGKEYPVDDSELPVILPEVESYEPSGTGESPLANITEWVNVEGTITKEGTFISKDKAPQGSEIKTYKRETNTMPQWAGSSWYYLRFMDPHNTQEIVDKNIEKYWNQVDMYVGGAEHATRHLIYARFWHKVLFDIGAVSTDEPFKRLQHVGLIAGEDGRKMSKRFGNVVNPDDVINTYGADAFRMYEMFMGPFDQGAAWSTKGVVGTRRFLERVFALKQKIQDIQDTPEVLLALHSANNKIATDIENFKLNTSVSTLMILLNSLETAPAVSLNTYKHLLCLLAPFAPHMTEELWYGLGEKTSVHKASWPSYNPSYEATASVTIAVQVNGKKRGVITVPKDASEETVRAAALADENIKSWLDRGTEKKLIYRPNMVINYLVDEKLNN